MVLMHRVIVDLEGFNEEYFGIFPTEDQQELYRIWERDAARNPNKFIALLSPEHQRCVAAWATSRTSYNVVELVKGLEKFVRFLKTVNYSSYPKPKKRPSRKKSSVLKKLIYE